MKCILQIKTGSLIPDLLESGVGKKKNLPMLAGAFITKKEK
jgi:hypothetical protein